MTLSELILTTEAKIFKSYLTLDDSRLKYERRNSSFSDGEDFMKNRFQI